MRLDTNVPITRVPGCKLPQMCLGVVGPVPGAQPLLDTERRATGAQV